MQDILKLSQIHYGSLPWDHFVHFTQRSIDISGILYVLETGQEQQKKMALITLANSIEQKGAVLSSTAMVLPYLFSFFEKEQDLSGLYLRVFLKVCKAVGFQWENYLDGKNKVEKAFGQWVWDEGSVYRWPSFESQSQDELLWATASDKLMFDHPWYFTKDVLLAHQDVLEKKQGLDLISKGILYEISTILNMIKDQERFVFQDHKIWESERLSFVPISLEYLTDYQSNLTPKVAEFLSFDAMDNAAIWAEFIKRSEIEYKRGACIVLVVLDKQDKSFLGSCGIHDINVENVELGLWLKESSQGKGYGSEILQKLMDIVKEFIPTKGIIYNLEQDNVSSIKLCEKFGFKHKYDFVIEPNNLKNKMRHMKYYYLQV